MDKKQIKEENRRRLSYIYTSLDEINQYIEDEMDYRDPFYHLAAIETEIKAIRHNLGVKVSK